MSKADGQDAGTKGRGVPRGYKQTEVGVIPEEWSDQILGSIATVAAGSTPSRRVPEYWGGNIPWVTTTEIDFNTINSSAECISSLGLRNSAVKLLRPGTLLMALYGQGKTRGKVAMLGIEATTNQACASITVAPSVSRSFVFQFLSSRYEAIRGMSNAGSQDNLNGNIVKSIRVPIPPTKAEQDAIAEALSDADALIESLEQLLAKKRDLKQGAMQELLTGKSRLPSFSGEWQTKQLGDICQMKSGASITSENIDAFSQFPCYGGNGLRGFTSEHTHDGTFALIGRQGALCGNVIVVSGKFFASEHAIVVTPTKGTDVNWLALVLARMNLNQYAESSAQPGLSVSKLQSFTCVVPSFDEQTSIAAIVSAMDVEIVSLESKLTKARHLKQGMMQELLTGRIRLI